MTTDIEHMREPVGSVLGHQIDPTIWQRFARGQSWEWDLVEALAKSYQEAEPNILSALAELDVEEAK